MRFIRDIISEKRSARPEGAVAATAEAEMPRFDPPPPDPYDDVEAALDAEFAQATAVMDLPPEPVRERVAEAPGTLVLEATQLRPPRPVAEPAPRPAAAELPEILRPAVPDEPPITKRPISVFANSRPASRPVTMPLPMMEQLSQAAAQPRSPEPAHQPELSEMPFVSVRPGDEAPASIEVPPPAAGRGANRSGRVKTRLLGFNPEALSVADPLARAESRAGEMFPVGWLVVVAGPGRGAAFALHDGVSRVGRGEDQTVSLNFGDNSISRENHVAIAYDSEQNGFFIGQSGKSNIVRLNNKPLLSTEPLRSGDRIRVGETTLRLVALCGEDFSWAASA